MRYVRCKTASFENLSSPCSSRGSMVQHSVLLNLLTDGPSRQCARVTDILKVSLRTPARGTTRIALEAGAIADHRVIAAFATAIALVALEAGFGAFVH
jgi:hypothetical protein